MHHDMNMYWEGGGNGVVLHSLSLGNWTDGSKQLHAPKCSPMAKELRYSLVTGCVVFEVSLNTEQENLLLMPQIQSLSPIRSASSLPTITIKLCRNSDDEESEVGKGVAGRGRDLNESILQKSSWR